MPGLADNLMRLNRALYPNSIAGTVVVVAKTGVADLVTDLDHLADLPLRG